MQTLPGKWMISKQLPFVEGTPDADGRLRKCVQIDGRMGGLSANRL